MGECEASGGKNREPGSCGPDGVLPRAGLMEGEQGHPRFGVQSGDCLTLEHKYGMPQALECRGRKGFFSSGSCSQLWGSWPQLCLAGVRGTKRGRPAPERGSGPSLDCRVAQRGPGPPCRFFMLCRGHLDCPTASGLQPACPAPLARPYVALPRSQWPELPTWQSPIWAGFRGQG